MLETKEESKVWKLRFYIAGQTPKTTRAVENLKKISNEHFADKYKIEVIDIREHPEIAKNEQIIGVITILG